MNSQLCSSPLALFTLGLLVHAAVTVGHAADSPSPPPLSLPDALARVERGHPWLRGREAEARLAEARVAAAQARPVGEASLLLEQALGTGELRAAHALETTLQFSRALESADRLAARTGVARELNDVERLAWEERRRALFAETTRRFIDVVATQADLAAARERVDLATKTENAVRERLDRAVGTPADVARARHARVEAEIEAEHVEYVLLAARHGLALLWGASAADFETAVADLDTLPAIATYETIAPKLAEAPAQARFGALARWRLAQEMLANVAATRGSPRWLAGVRRVEVSDDWGLVFGLNYAWPERALASAQAAESRAERERTEIEGEAALIAIKQVLFELVQELGHARIEHTAAREELIPAAESWLASVEAGMAAARFALRDVLEAQAAVIEARRHQINAAAEYHRNLVAIESLLGGSASANP